MVSTIVLVVVALVFVLFMFIFGWNLLRRLDLIKDARKMVAKKPRLALTKPTPGSTHSQWEAFIDEKIEPHKKKSYPHLYKEMHPLQTFLAKTHNDLCATLDGYETNRKECDTLYLAKLHLHLSTLLASNTTDHQKNETWQNFRNLSSNNSNELSTLERLQKRYLSNQAA